MEEYLQKNRASWNKRTAHHIDSQFYDVAGFVKGKSSLNSIELELLGDISGKSILHLQCHFGQDTLSMARMGAKVTGVDLSDISIKEARNLSNQIGHDATFICCDVYDLPSHLSEKFDIVFTSYGVIGWLPDLIPWAKTIRQFLKPDGEFIMVEFHPFVWMFNETFESIEYSYFNRDAIVDIEKGTYAAPEAPIETENIQWNHGFAEMYHALLSNGIIVNHFQEFDYSPYDCFLKAKLVEERKFMIAGLEGKIPLVYSIKAGIDSNLKQSEHKKS